MVADPWLGLVLWLGHKSMACLSEALQIAVLSDSSPCAFSLPQEDTVQEKSVPYPGAQDKKIQWLGGELFNTGKKCLLL
jgi:hypothetical protein